MLKKLALAAAGITAGLTLLAPSAAFANGDTGPQYRTVNPGQTVCITGPYALQSARGELTVTSGHPVRVQFGTTVRPTIYDSLYPVSTAAPEINNWVAPGALPGTPKLCAVNQSLKVSYVSMRVISQ